jgi:hypothetical protein
LCSSNGICRFPVRHPTSVAPRAPTTVCGSLRMGRVIQELPQTEPGAVELRSG